MKNDHQDIQSILQQIADILLINGGILNNTGLYSGEMGLMLFFSRYGRYTQHDLYMEYAYCLMERIQKRIHQDTPIDYKQGLSGIGSAIEYLVQNGYFEADTDEMLNDFDKRIFFTYNLTYLTINEIMAIGFYALWRMAGNSSKKNMIQQMIMPHIEKMIHAHSVNPSCLQLNQHTIPVGFEEKTWNRCLELIVKNDFWGKEMGIQHGLAGWGLALLTELDGDKSWFSLFPNYFSSTYYNDFHEII